MMLSYHNDNKLKSMMIKEMELHRKQDQFIKGSYGKENGTFHGCSVGCAVHSLNRIKGINIPYDNHSKLADAIGVPEWLWRLNDTLFENLPDGDNSEFSVKFLKSIPVGVDLEPVKWKFCAFIMEENIERVLTLRISDELKKQVVDAIRGSLAVNEEAIRTGVWDESAASAARSAESAAARAAWSAASAARSAESAARSAAWSAERSAAWSAESAARSAAWSAESAARSAAWSAESAAWSAAESAAWSAESAESAAWSAAYIKYRDELLRLLKEAK